MPVPSSLFIDRLLALTFVSLAALSCNQSSDNGSMTFAATSGSAGAAANVGVANTATQPTAAAGASAAANTSAAAGTNAAANAGAAGVSGSAAAAAGSSADPAANSSAAGITGAAAAAGSSAGPAASSGASTASGAAGTAASSGSTMLPPPPVPPPFKWTRCGTAFECADLKVPLDYADPSGEQINLKVQRRATTYPQRIGSLLINPGGPGASAIEFLQSFVQIASPTLTSHFDIVAFDPRGVGQSTPIDCHSTVEKLAGVDPTPHDDAGWKASDDEAKTFADECAQKYPKLLPHLGTDDVARDMDQVRAALGEPKLSYLGFSYGTSLGAHYAQQFPQNIRALVLDGALDMNISALEISKEQAVGFDKSLQAFFGWCGKAATNCSWANGGTPAQAFKDLSAKIEKTPIPGADSRKVGPGEFLIGVLAPLYSGEDGYRQLSSALTSAARGDGSGMQMFADSYLERKSDGSYGNIQEANSAVNCLDDPAPDYTAIRAEASNFEMASETFGLATLTGLLVCAHWPVKGEARAPAMMWGAGGPTILVVGTTGDPATPYAWAEALTKELASGVLLTYEGEGHTAYLRSNSCIDNAVEAYLIDGKAPADGTRCSGNSAPMPLTLPSMLGPNGPRPAPRQFFPSDSK